MELSAIKGIGAATIEKLGRLGISSPKDLYNFLPVSYIDLSKPATLASAKRGQFVLLRVKIVKISSEHRAKSRLTFFRAEAVCSLSDGKFDEKSKGNKLSLIWFNQPYFRNSLAKNEEYLILGKLILKGGCLEMVNPVFEPAECPKNLKGIMTIYRTRGMIYQHSIKAYQRFLTDNFRVNTLISDTYIEKFDIDDINEAYYKAHFPKSVDEGIAAQKRIALEDAVNLLIAYKLYAKNAKNKRLISYNKSFCIVDKFINKLPFNLTPSQVKALDEIAADLKSEKYMNRILSGDVGSGKTVLAFATMYFVVNCGFQAAMMAPTEILAEQHYNSACKLFAGLSIKIDFLSSSTPQSKKQRILEDLATGITDIIIGTHSLFQKEVKFSRLALTVIDEQHKFGVNQKSAFEQLSKTSDTLTLSATPIPRALALILYGDLQESTIFKRLSQSIVQTALVPDKKLTAMFEYIKERVKNGEQAFIVCPRITDSEGLDIYSANQLYDELKNGIFKDIRVELLHGKQKSDKKTDVMQNFAEGNIDVLVATTVVEVGVDVPNATVMAVLNSDRFGLATLHQLRGRVGRGEKGGYCFLHTAEESENKRIEILKNYNDGFKIAEMDFDLRGGGDFLGTRQCGETAIGSYIIPVDINIIKKAKVIANEIWESDNVIDDLFHMNFARYYEILKDVSVN